jgi:hypothetical protein
MQFGIEEGSVEGGWIKKTERLRGQKQMVLIVGHLATPLSEAALANAAQRSC